MKPHLVPTFLCSIALMSPLASVRAETAEPRPETTKTMPTYTAFMMIRTTPAFLAMSPEERLGFLGSDIAPILEAHPTVSMRFYDTEFYSSEVSDVVVWETEDLSAYQSIVERLRETPFWGEYFEVRQVLLGQENAYASYYEAPETGTE